MKTIFDDYVYELEIQKSKFYGIVFHIESIDEFKEKLKKIQKDYPKATHYCYAYSMGIIKKNNDDGEPSGTAGNPILETIINNDVDHVGVVVVRYFGGIKLGAGGLTRAYRSAANEALKNASIKELVNTQTYKLSFDYSFNSQINKYLEQKSIKIIDTIYDIKVVKTIATNLDINELINLTNGKIEIEKDKIIEIIK